MATAFDDLIEQNMQLVPFAVHRYFMGFNNPGIEFEDMVGLGNIGLVKAARRFNSETGYKFATYAVPMICGEIARHIRDHKEVIKASRYVKALAYKITPDLEDIPIPDLASRFNVTEKEVKTALDYNQARQISSLDEQISNDNPRTAFEFLGKQEEFDFPILVHQIRSILTPRERLVFDHLYLFDETQATTSVKAGVSQVEVYRITKRIRAKVAKLLRTDLHMAAG